jgi:thioredoxin-like negative regulator of GroEL
MVKEVTDQNLAEYVLEAETPVFIDFWAPWCAPAVWSLLLLKNYQMIMLTN